jgi:Tfp pilus assembly PilM family ATPase
MLHYTEAIGLDIGSHAAKAVHVRRRWGRIAIESADWVRLPADEHDRQRVLESFVTKKGWRGLPCVLAPPMDGVMLQSIRVQPHDPRPFSSIVDLEMSQFSGLAEDSTIRDYSVSRDADGSRILLAVGRVDSVEASLDLAIASGLNPVQVTPQATALFNIVSRRWRGSRKSTFVVINIGHRSTNVIVGTRSTLLDARHMPHGGNLLGDGVQAIGSDAGSQSATELNRWLDALCSCLAVCEGMEDIENLPVDGVILCGGASRTEGLKQALATRLNKPVQLLRELGRISYVEDVERRAVATGLALAGMGIGRIQLTLLPPKTRETITLHSQANYWIGSGCALVAALLVLLVGASVELYLKQNYLAHARSMLSSITALEAKQADLQKRNERLEAQVRPFAAVVHNGDILRTAIGAVSRAKRPNDWIARIADANAYFDGTDVIPEGISPFSQLVIEGHTPTTDFSSVRSMIETLRNSPGILDADLLGDDTLRTTTDANADWIQQTCERFVIGFTLPTP